MRRLISHSHKTKSKLEQERLRRKAIEKREGSKDRARKRKQALKIFNDEQGCADYLVKGHKQLDSIKEGGENEEYS